MKLKNIISLVLLSLSFNSLYAVTIKWESSQVPKKHFVSFASYFKKAVEKKSLGKMKVEFSHLGDDVEDKELFVFLDKRNKLISGGFGSNLSDLPFHMTEVYSSDLADTYSLFDYNIFDYPFLFSDFKQVNNFLDSSTGEKLVLQLNNVHVKNLGFVYTHGFRAIPSDYVKIRKIKDFKKLKFRTDLGVLNRAFYKELGAKIIFDRDDLDDSKYDNLDNGDTSIGVLEEYFIKGSKETAKYLNLTKHSIITSGVLIHKGFLNSLTKEQRAIIYSAMKETITFQRKYMKEQESIQIDRVKKQGFPIYLLSNSERNKLKKLVEDKFKKFNKKFSSGLMKKAKGDK
ncbi:TRAP transporter substrate-binding protein DctP [Bacteriovoracaceae bacterium]|nr:TRAP transporter substrate-binding protein DctP [Bacteriovoracaceae bacterium]